MAKDFKNPWGPGSAEYDKWQPGHDKNNEFLKWLPEGADFFDKSYDEARGEWDSIFGNNKATSTEAVNLENEYPIAEGEGGDGDMVNPNFFTSDNSEGLNKVNGEKAKGLIVVTRNGYANYRDTKLFKGQELHNVTLSEDAFAYRAKDYLESLETVSIGNQLVDYLSKFTKGYCLIVNQNPSNPKAVMEYQALDYESRSGELRAARLLNGIAQSDGGANKILQGLSHELFHAYQQMTKYRRRTLIKEFDGLVFGFCVRRKRQGDFSDPFSSGSSLADETFFNNLTRFVTAQKFDVVFYKAAYQAWLQTPYGQTYAASSNWEDDQKYKDSLLSDFFPLFR